MYKRTWSILLYKTFLDINQTVETKSFIFYALPFPLSFKHTFSAVSRASAEMQGGPLYPTSEVSALVGCEDAERELVSRLLDGTVENLSVISLVSEEAVGKTALAKACLLETRHSAALPMPSLGPCPRRVCI